MTRLRVFETERLFASRWIPAQDAEAAYAIYGDPEVVRFIGGEVMPSVEAQRERLEAMLERDRGRPEGMGGLPLVRRKDGLIIGLALIKPLPDADRVDTEDIEIGWHLGRAHWGQGYATEAGRALLRYGLDALGLDTVYAVVDPPNHRSLAVARRLPMRALGRTELYYGCSLELFASDPELAPGRGPEGAENAGDSVIT